MDAHLTEDNMPRLIRLIIEKFKVSYAEADQILQSYKLSIICGEEVKESKSDQAALLTAINTGKRCFLGGVEVVMPRETKALVAWPEKTILNDIVEELGGTLVESPSVKATFYILIKSDDKQFENSLHLVCDTWRGGISKKPMRFGDGGEISSLVLGGIAAGSLGVAGAFFAATGIKPDFMDNPTGISLWKPDVFWLNEEAQGPRGSFFLPKRLWILGLGHLGQAYLWSIGLMTDPKLVNEMTLLLQDFDSITKANFSTGVLSEYGNIGIKKARMCADWLEKRNIEAVITERRFDAGIKVGEYDPKVALCGFDNSKARQVLDEANFEFIVECGLGSTFNNFDKFHMHTLPHPDYKAKDIWTSVNHANEVDIKTIKVFRKETEENECGIIAMTLAEKAIASSFVGVLASTVVISELLRGLAGEHRYSQVVSQARFVDKSKALYFSETSQKLLVPNGFLEIA